MSLVAEKASVTPDELLAMPNEKDYELVDGVLRERNMGALSGWIGGNIVCLLSNHVKERGLGWVFPNDFGFQCFGEDSNTMRRPDVCFVRADRLSAKEIGEGYLRVVPDLVVEVVSPNDTWEEVEEKVELFHKAGVPLIWVVSPNSRLVWVDRSDGSISLLRVGDEISGENVVPGFVCPIASFFPPEPRG